MSTPDCDCSPTDCDPSDIVRGWLSGWEMIAASSDQFGLAEGARLSITFADGSTLDAVVYGLAHARISAGQSHWRGRGGLRLGVLPGGRSDTVADRILMDDQFQLRRGDDGRIALRLMPCPDGGNLIVNDAESVTVVDKVDVP